MRSENVLLSIVIAAAAGAAVGVLFAPAKGSLTRKKLGRKGINYAEGFNERLNEYADTVSEDFDAVKESAVDFANRGKKKASSLL